MSTTAEKAEAIAAPVIKDLGLELWDVRFIKEGASYYLRVFIDKPGGVTLDDCESVSRALDGPLDEADVIEPNYYLEVSSPGAERELCRDWHFPRYEGQNVEVKLYKAVFGSKRVAGTLAEYRAGEVTMKVGEETMVIAKENVAKVNVKVF